MIKNHLQGKGTDSPIRSAQYTEHGAIHTGDCLEVMKTLPNGSVRAVVTSPPYNIRNSTGNGLRDGRGGKWKNAALRKGYNTYSDNMSYRDYVRWQRKCLREMMRVIADDGVIFYNHKSRVQGGLWQSPRAIINGFPVRQEIIWQRAGGINFNTGYFLPTYETVYMIAKPGFNLAPKTNAMGDVWSIPQERKNPHPAPFPVELARRCCAAIGHGEVLDPFFGSGTTGVAAELMGLNWRGIELSKQYADASLQRVEPLKATLVRLWVGRT